MGQIFHAVAFDSETRNKSVVYADKFHANCYSYSGAVLNIHYLLRQKAYRVLWGGDYMGAEEELRSVDGEDDLVSLSTYLEFDGYEDDDLKSKGDKFFNRVQKIRKYAKEWNRINVYDEAMDYFDWDETKSVAYTGYLVNHTQKLAVSLEDYFEKSVAYYGEQELGLIDLVPALTETGGGIQMALFYGLSEETTEELAGSWCANLLQIVDELPEAYQQIDCCFAEVWAKAKYCYDKYGVDDKGYLFKGGDRSYFEAYSMSIFGQRKTRQYIKIEAKESKVKFSGCDGIE